MEHVITELTAYLRGWWNYFSLIESKNRLDRLDVWIRRRLRAMVWKQWKRPKTRIAELVRRGIHPDDAGPVGASRKGPWRLSKVKWVVFALSEDYFASLGLVIPWTSNA